MAQVMLGGKVLYSAGSGQGMASFAQTGSKAVSNAFGALAPAPAAANQSGGDGIVPVSRKELAKVDKFLKVAINLLASIDGSLKQRLSNQRFKYNADIAAAREAAIEGNDQTISSAPVSDAVPEQDSSSTLIGLGLIGIALATQFDPIKEQMKTLYDFSKSVGEKVISVAKTLNGVFSFFLSKNGETNTQPVQTGQTSNPAPDTSRGWFARQAAPEFNPPASSSGTNITPAIQFAAPGRPASPGSPPPPAPASPSRPATPPADTSKGWFARQAAPDLNPPAGGVNPAQAAPDTSKGWFARQAAPDLNPQTSAPVWPTQDAKHVKTDASPGGKLKDHVNSLFRLGGGNTGNIDNLNNLDPKFEASVVSMLKEYKQQTGKMPVLTSGFRTFREQQEVSSAYMKATPGTSRHERGLALDFNAADVNKMRSLGLLSKYGLHQRYGAKDPVHIEPIGAGGGTDPIYGAAGEDGGKDADALDSAVDTTMKTLSKAFKGLRELGTIDTSTVPFQNITSGTPNKIGEAAKAKYAEMVSSKNKPMEMPEVAVSLPNLNASQPNGTVQNPGGTESDAPILYQYLQYFNVVSTPPPALAATELV